MQFVSLRGYGSQMHAVSTMVSTEECEPPSRRRLPTRPRRRLGFWLVNIARHLRDHGPARRCEIMRAMKKVRATFTNSMFGNVVSSHPWFAKEGQDGPFGRFFLTEEGRQGLEKT